MMVPKTWGWRAYPLVLLSSVLATGGAAFACVDARYHDLGYSVMFNEWDLVGGLVITALAFVGVHQFRRRSIRRDL